MNIEKVLVRGRCTIVFWDDGTKTTVKCSREDTENFEAAISASVLKKVLGSRAQVKVFLEGIRSVTVFIEDVPREKRKAIRQVRKGKAIRKAMKGAGTVKTESESQGVSNETAPDPEEEVLNMSIVERRAEAVRLYDAGKTYEEIGCLLNITRETARSYVSRGKADLMKKRYGDEASASKVDTGKMMALLEAGWKTEDVAIEFSVSSQTIRTVFYKHTGVKLGDWRKQQKSNRV